MAASKSTLQVQCDMATWTSDDTKIITSQCCMATSTALDMVPGSHIIHVWDSRTGQCIIGLPSVHTKPCPVLVSHPSDPSIMVSAGADGHVRVWNLTTGKCLFSHENVHQYGALENPSERGKSSGYLDGTFSPDGLNLVLTDESGRITIIDTLESEQETKAKRDDGSSITCDDPSQRDDDQNVAPFWMREQYFANDYYELFYDTNGYCIERGSRQPPHLAPEAARCNHTGSAYGSVIQVALSMLPGPIPLQEEVVRANRDDLRLRSFQIRKPGGILAKNVLGTRTLIEAYPSASSYVMCGDSSVITRMGQVENPTLPPIQAEPQPTRPPNRSLSTRYRWIDYDDIAREDDGAEVDEPESDYDENEAPERERRTDSARSRRRNNRTVARREARREVEIFEEIVNNEPVRMSARQSARRSEAQPYNDDGSEASIIEEMLSSNTSPSGEYIKDYTELGHLFKIPNGGELRRKWASRNNCIEGYTGWKTYAPQVGDSIVYVPRAHSDTLQTYPICNSSETGAPWKSWPTVSQWPVVRCEVKDIRYRFPYNGYFGSRSR